MRSLLAYSDQDGSAPSKGGVLLLQLGIISVVHRQLRLPWPGDRFCGSMVALYGQAESIRAFIDGLKADFGFNESQRGFAFLYALLLKDEAQRLETQELVAQQLEGLGLTFPWPSRHDLFLFDPGQAERILKVFLGTSARYAWYDDYAKQLALRPTRCDPDTGMVVEAVCGFCASTHETADDGIAVVNAVDQTWEWPFRVKAMARHAATQHAAAFAELSRLTKDRRTAVTEDSVQDAEAAIQHFIEHPTVSAIESPDGSREVDQGERMQREWELTRVAMGLDTLEKAVQERERLSETERQRNQQQERELRDWDKRLCERELECDRVQSENLKRGQDLQQQEEDFQQREQQLERREAAIKPDDTGEQPEQICCTEVSGKRKRGLRDWDHELGDRKLVCDRVQDEYLRLIQEMSDQKQQDAQSQLEWKQQREQEFRNWEQNLREREMTCIREKWHGKKGSQE